MKRQLLLLCLLVAALSRAQDLAKPITYRTVAVPLHSALDAISGQAGVKLIASTELGDEPVILSVHGASLKDTMDHIGVALGATWTDRGHNEFELERSPRLAEELEQKAIAYWAAKIKKSIDRMASDMGPESDSMAVSTAQAFAGVVSLSEHGSHYGPTLRKIEPRLPIDRALVRLLKLMSPTDLASVQKGQSMVFSNRPTPMQRPLPPGCDEIAERFQTEQNAFAAEFAKQHPAPLKDSMQEMHGKDVLRLAKQPERFILKVSKGSFLMAEAVALDASGSTVGFAEDAVREDSIDTMNAKGGAITASESKNPEIPLSPESEIISASCKAAIEGVGHPPPLSLLSRNLLLRPTVHDPLSFLVSDGLFAVGGVSHSNLVAYPTDDLFVLNFAKEDNGTFKLPSLLASLDEEFEVSSSDGWTVVTPRDKLAALNERTDRGNYEKCLQEADRQGYISIGTSAELARSYRVDYVPDMAGLMMIFGERYDPYFKRGLSVLRFYGSLSSGEIDMLKGGGKLEAGAMSKEQWNFLNKIAYDDSSGDTEIEGVAYDGGFGDSFLASEPTEFMPASLPADAYVTMTSKDSDVLFADWKTVDGWEFVTEEPIKAIARMVAGQQVNPASSRSSIQWLSPGLARDTTFRFVLTPTHSLKGTLHEVVRKEEQWPLDKLPSDLKQRLDAAVVEARKALDQASAEAPAPSAQPPR